jgi:uncharacterized protein with PIN domain
MSETIRLIVPESLLWCVYPGRTWDGRSALLPWFEHQSVKDCAESVGIPHTEIERYLVDGNEVDESSSLLPGQELEVTAADSLPYIDRDFVLDVHLGKLAVFLRLSGFHAVYDPQAGQQELIELSHRDNHMLLTRSRELLKHRDVERGMLVRSDDPEQQLLEVFERFDLSAHVSILSICPVCGGRLEPVSKQRILERLKPGTREHYQDFYQCQSCTQVFWEGTHYPGFIEMLKRVRKHIRS